MSIDAALAEAYARALYVIETGDTRLTRRVGVVDAEADAVLREHGCRIGWWIVTPCNPRSLALSGADNAERLNRCAVELRALRWTTLPSHNSAEDGDWREPGFCIFDVDAEAVSALARRYGQSAIVGARLGTAPALRWLED